MLVNATARSVRTGLLALVLAAAAVSPAPAQQPSAIALAKEIILIKGGDKLYGPLVPQIIDRARVVFLNSNPMLGGALNEVAAKLRTELGPRGAELVNEGAKVYASRFTEQELKDALAFYKSPLGRKIIEQEPLILDQSVANLETWATRFSEEVIGKFRTEMRKKGHEI
jgi:uncharacterized protein